MKKKFLPIKTRLAKLVAGLLVCGGMTNVVSAQTVVTVQGEITSNTTWQSCKQYLLTGYVYVTDGATLTIEPGTIIKGDKNTKGAFDNRKRSQADGGRNFCSPYCIYI